MSQTVAAGVEQVTIYNSLMPPEGPKGMPVQLDFSTSGSLLVDFTLPMNQRRISAIQTISVRNWLNTASLTITIQGFSEPFDIPAYTDVVMPIPAANLAKFIFSTTTNLIIPVTFYNIPLPSVALVNPAGGTPVTIAGVLTTTPQEGTATAGTVFTVAVGGTAVSPLVGIVHGARIVNPAAAVESLFVDLVNAAGTAAPGANGTTEELLPGQAFNAPPTSGTVSVNAATGGHTFTVYKW